MREREKKKKNNLFQFLYQNEIKINSFDYFKTIEIFYETQIKMSKDDPEPPKVGPTYINPNKK